MLLKLRARVIRDQLVLDSGSNDLLISCPSSPFLAEGAPGSSSGPSRDWANRWPPDFDLRRPRRGLLNRPCDGESRPRRRVSATTTLKPPDNGEMKGPGIIRDIECLAGVTGRSAGGGAGPCW